MILWNFWAASFGGGRGGEQTNTLIWDALKYLNFPIFLVSVAD